MIEPVIKEKLKIEEFLNDYFTIEGTYIISDDFVVDINGNISLKYKKFNEDGLTELPIQFGHITGYFDFENVNIETMKGFPYTVDLYCAIDDCEKIKSLEFSPKCNEFYCHKCIGFESLDGLNCNKFYGKNLKLKRIGINFSSKYFSFNNFPTPTALKKHTEEFSMLDEIMYLNNKKPLFKYISTMRHFIQLNPELLIKVEFKEQWITLINDYFQNKDIFKAIQEFEELYNEPWMKPEDRIDVINTDLTISL